MNTYIALLRGINVGGNHKLPMKELVSILEEIGFEDAATYIQSGNAVFRSKRKSAPRISKQIGAAIKEKRGFEPRVHVIGLDELQQAMASNPYPDAEEEPKTLHLGFLEHNPKDADLDAMDELSAANESFSISGCMFYLHAPDGIGRSKLADKAERLLGVSMTLRNWRTVTKVCELAIDIDA